LNSLAQEFDLAFALSRNLDGVSQAAPGERFFARQRNRKAEQGANPVHFQLSSAKLIPCLVRKAES
jgi:hypothetical protein